MLKMSVVTIGGSFLQSAGWKLLQDYVNSSTKVGIYTDDDTPFYEGLVDYDNHVNFLSSPLKINGKDINPFTGKAVLGNTNTARKNLVEADVNGLNYTSSSNITNAPVENGGFISVNKIILPTQNNVNYIVTGSEKQRAYFLNACQKAKNGLYLFTVHTLNQSFKNMNIISYTVARDEKSIQLFHVSLSLAEVVNKPSSNDLDYATAFSGEGEEVGNLEGKDATSLEKQMAGKKQ